ncbi:MAG: hypothetical protein M1837_004881 [Sclerophora amabilis]|nr:MAG: hypothetical protein M1837_004881 [Sclerophora amabilis]
MKVHTGIKSIRHGQKEKATGLDTISYEQAKLQDDEDFVKTAAYKAMDEAIPTDVSSQVGDRLVFGNRPGISLMEEIREAEADRKLLRSAIERLQRKNRSQQSQIDLLKAQHEATLAQSEAYLTIRER